MHILRPVRLFLVRRPWAYWVVVLALGAAVGLGVNARLEAVDDAKRSWGDTSLVWVAAQDAAPGAIIVATRLELPLVAIPSSVVTDLAVDTIARQQVTRGEPITTADTTVGRGPAAGADDGEVVVPLSDPLLGSAPVGVDVSIYAEGIVLAAQARIVQIDDGVIFVAVSASEAPMVAAAAQLRTASVVFTRE